MNFIRNNGALLLRQKSLGNRNWEKLNMLKKSISSRVAGALAISAFALSLGVSAANEAKAVDFKGKRIRVIIPFNEGGGTDSLARFMQPFLERHLPGKPKLLIVNKPGAGGIVGGNYFQQRSKKDGTWVMAVSISTVMNYVLGDPRVKFDILKWEPIALLPRSAVIYARKELGLKGLSPKEQLAKMKSMPKSALVMGGKTPTSTDINYRGAFSLLGLELKNVWGMKGNGPMALAFERGEFTLMYDNSLSYLNNRKHFRDSGIAVELFTWGAPAGDGSWKDAKGNWRRDPTWPKLPTFFEYYEQATGKKFEGAAAGATLKLTKIGVGANKAYLLQTQTPKPIVKAWRDAFAKAMKDPEFVKKKDRIIGAYPVTVGAAAGTAMKEIFSLNKAEKAYIRKYLKSRYDLDLNI
jgi:tripartite-type tricarboxylate transporter receptor subunit TctC